MEVGADLPQGTLDLLILKVIAFGAVHGYAIAHRLENRGLLAADWKQTETGREAKFYRLTRKGRRHLETEADGGQRLTEAIGLILGMAEGGIR
jgi:DNA-binding PadR family transcriptional regulator